MHIHSVVAIALAMVLSPWLAAQGCSHQTTRTVPSKIETGPSADCGGFTYSLPGVAVHNETKGCPLFVLYTPEHEVSVPTHEETRVVVRRSDPVTMAFFYCDSSYFLVFRLSNTCKLDRVVTVGQVDRLIVVPCNGQNPAVGGVITP